MATVGSMIITDLGSKITTVKQWIPTVLVDFKRIEVVVAVVIGFRPAKLRGSASMLTVVEFNEVQIVGVNSMSTILKFKLAVPKSMPLFINSMFKALQLISIPAIVDFNEVEVVIVASFKFTVVKFNLLKSMPEFRFRAHRSIPTAVDFDGVHVSTAATLKSILDFRLRVPISMPDAVDFGAIEVAAILGSKFIIAKLRLRVTKSMSGHSDAKNSSSKSINSIFKKKNI